MSHVCSFKIIYVKRSKNAWYLVITNYLQYTNAIVLNILLESRKKKKKYLLVPLDLFFFIFFSLIVVSGITF